MCVWISFLERKDEIEHCSGINCRCEATKGKSAFFLHLSFDIINKKLYLTKEK